MQLGLLGPETFPSESVQTPFAPQVPLPSWAVPEVANESDVVPPVLAAVPVLEGANTVVSIGWIAGLAPPPALPPLPVPAPAPPPPDAEDGPTREEGSLLQPARARTARNAAAMGKRDMMQLLRRVKGAPTCGRRRP